MLFHAWVEAHRASLLDSLKRLGKQPIGSFFTCLVMAVALSLPMGLSLLLNNVERLGGSWQRAAQISLYLQMDASNAQGEQLSNQIKGMPGVADAEFISREKALEEFQQQSVPGEALFQPLAGAGYAGFHCPTIPVFRWTFYLLQRDPRRSEERRVGKECRSRWSPYH